MPTGYTADILEGDGISVSEFVRRAGRGMGFAIDLRDTLDKDLEVPFRPVFDEYHYKNLLKAKEELEKWNDLSPEDRLVAWQEYVEEVRKSNDESQARTDDTLNRLNRIRKPIEAWEAPEELENFKKFMLEQIDSTIEFDGRPWVQEILPPDVWVESQQEYYEKNVTYHVKQLGKSVERNLEQHKYVRLFLEAVEHFKEWENL